MYTKTNKMMAPLDTNVGHFGDDYYRTDDPTNSVKALKEAGFGH